MKIDTNRPFAALAGVAFCVLVIAGTLLAPSDPSFADSPDVLAAYFADNQGAVLASATLYMLSGACLLVFAALLRDVAAAGGARLASVVHGGGIAGGTLWIGSAAIIAGGALRAGEQGSIDPTTAASIWDIGNILYGSAAPIALATLVLGLAATGALPRWHSALSVVLGIAMLIPMINFVAVVVFGFWCLLTGGMLFLAPGSSNLAVGAAPARA